MALFGNCRLVRASLLDVNSRQCFAMSTTSDQAQPQWPVPEPGDTTQCPAGTLTLGQNTSNTGKPCALRRHTHTAGCEGLEVHELCDGILLISQGPGCIRLLLNLLHAPLTCSTVQCPSTSFSPHACMLTIDDTLNVSLALSDRVHCCAPATCTGEA